MGAEGEGAPTVPAGELVEVLRRLGAPRPVVLEQRLALALGGDTSLAKQAIRLSEAAPRVDLYRKSGPGGRRMFPSTPVVPLKEWYPLQARRIRYFKKKKEKQEKPGDGADS